MKTHALHIQFADHILIVVIANYIGLCIKEMTKLNYLNKLLLYLIRYFI